MKSFREILSEKAPEKKYRSPQQLNINIGGAPSSTSAPSTGGIVKRNVGATKPRPSSGSTAAEVSARAQRFSQAFGTPTGADPRTGAPTYRPPAELTNLPSSRTGATPSPEAYSKVKPGDLEIKRQARTAEVPGKPGVRSATPQGVQNFLLNRETGGMSRRSIPAEQGRAAQQRVAQSMQNPNVVADISARINQEVGGRRAETSTPAEPFSVSEKDKKILQRMARPTTSIPSAQSLTRQLGTGAGFRAQAEADAAAGSAAEPETQRRRAQARAQRRSQGFADLQRAIDAQPEPQSSTPKPTPAPKVVKPKPTPAAVKPTPAPTVLKPPKIDLSKYKAPQVNLGTLKPVPAKATRLAPSATSSTSNLASTVNSMVRRNKAAEKVASRAASQTLKNIGRAATIAGTAFDVQQGYKASREEGGSVKRAIGAGISRGAGGLVGAATGARIGGMLAGAPGAVVGGVIGYTGGAEGLSNVYKKVTGDVGKKLTTQGVLTNIRKAVPQELRAQVPAGSRKTFTDFVKTAGRTYSNLTRSQDAKK